MPVVKHRQSGGNAEVDEEFAAQLVASGQWDVVEGSEKPADKPKRTRRTKEQIEADKAAEEAEKAAAAAAAEEEPPSEE